MDRWKAALLSLRAYLEVIRFALCAVAFVLALVGYWLAIRRFDRLNLQSLTAALAVACALAFANALNDIVDRETDQVNSPHRPIPSGRIDPRHAKWLVCWLGAISLICGAFSGGRMFLLAIFAVLSSALYNVWARKIALLGNSMVAVLCALTLAAGYCVAAGEFPFIPFASTFLFILARELIGTIGDAAGDRAGGRVSACMLWGAGTVLGISLALALLAVLVLCSPFFFADLVYPLGYILCISFTSIIPIGRAIFAIWKDRDPINIRRVSYSLRLVFFLNVLAFLWLVPKIQ
jgi:4-hydroxybenzoate polyprenyltransferase